MFVKMYYLKQFSELYTSEGFFMNLNTALDSLSMDLIDIFQSMISLWLFFNHKFFSSFLFNASSINSYIPTPY